MRPQFDKRDQSILDIRIQLWNNRSGPRVGDYIRLLDGSLARFTYEWPDGLQISSEEPNGSFYLGNGYMGYSGGLRPHIPHHQIQDTGEMKDGKCWFCHHDQCQAFNSVDVWVPCRIYQEVEL